MTNAARIVLGMLVASNLAAQAPPTADTAGFVVRLGRDTIALERTISRAGRLDGLLIRRTPGFSRTAYSALWAHRRGADSAQITFGPGPTSRTLALGFTGDSLDVVTTMPSGTTRRRLASQQAFLSLPESFGLFESWLSAFRLTSLDTGSARIFAPLGGPMGTLRLRKGGGDTVRIGIVGGEYLAVVDASGHLLSADGLATTLKYEVRRVTPAEMPTFVARMEAISASGEGLGALSGRDTVRATVQGVDIWIDYGRPRARGRPVFSAGVLGDTLWRTGANAATQLRVSGQVKLGGIALAPGIYSLWTRARPDSGFELVANSQSGQWGTQHDPKRDVGSAKLRRTDGQPHSEVFTIIIEAASGPRPAELILAWGSTRLAVPIEGAE